MIAHRPFVHALLVLLLLLSQQMGITHAVSHVSDSRHSATQAVAQLAVQDVSVSKALALDQSCEQCLAFAQIASALDTPYHSFPSASHTAPVSIIADTPAACQRTVCVFQSRAPPQYA